MRILKSNEKNLPKSGNHEKAICFWQEEFIKHTVLVEFSQKGRYDNTVFLNLMEKRVKEYVNSPNYSLDQDMKNMIDKYFTKHNGKYIQMEQRKLLQTEKRNEGIPLSLAKVIIASYGFPDAQKIFNL